ncbi:hypothetical protein MS3_00004074 [Schistosoma haematobium]|uniref:C2H2-type domain-containing protein n=1 Tax=Schistosoma haematobium TaxID=6185 RepID=A0A922LRE6_SCHHA|nr:hypothetical protein MS3_00004074 [Schistosoma haematobium]KAH9591998.1 hypothetical protein MS3_00004074 [Schistosoma haematobium]CAH8674800.1 unnamed protein product [Schistosoma haematobium]
MHCITSVLSLNSPEQMTESQQTTQKNPSPSSSIKNSEKQINTSIFVPSVSSSSSSTSSCSSVSSTSPQSTGLGLNFTKSFMTQVSEHSLNETSKSKINPIFQDGDSNDAQDICTANNNSYILPGFPSFCLGMSNDSLINQITNGHATNLLSIPTPTFSSSDLCMNKFPDNLVRSWTEGYPFTNSSFNTNTMITNIVNSTINSSRNNNNNNIITSIGANNTMLLRSHSTGLSSFNANNSHGLVLPLSSSSSSSENLSASGTFNNYHNDKSKPIISDNEEHLCNNLSVLNSYTDSNKSRNNYNNSVATTVSNITTTNSNNNSYSTSRKNDEDFCDLCQKHFCNKYYLRKHKTDVHGIHTEPYSHSRRRGNETQTVNNLSQIKNVNPFLTTTNNNNITSNVTGFINNASSDIDITIKCNNNNYIFPSDNSKIKDQVKGIDFTSDFDKSQMNDIQCELMKTQSPTKCELTNKSLSNIYDYIKCGSNPLLPSYVSEITNEKRCGNDEMTQWNRNCSGTTTISTTCSRNSVSISSGYGSNVNQSIDLTGDQSTLNEANSSCQTTTFNMTASCTHNIIDKNELNIEQKSMIDPSIVQSKNLNPLLSAQHYYMMALAANFSPSTAGLFNPSEVMAKSNLMPPLNPHLDIPLLSIPPSLDLNHVALREAQCDQCQKVFCNEYFLQLHRFSHQNNSDKLTLKNEKEQFDILENFPTEMEVTDSINKKDNTQHNTEKLSMDIEDNDNGDCESQKFNQNETKKEEIDSSLFFVNKSNTKEVNMNYPENSEFRLGTHSLDAFKNSMVAAKLADRVTCELCNKELCNKYFLRTHKIRVHGISPKDVGGPPMRNPPIIDNSSLNYSLNDLQTINCVTNSHQNNSILNFDENCKIDATLSDEMLNSFNSAYSTLGLVNQFLPLAYWPLFTSNHFISEQAVNCQLDKSLLPNFDNTVLWNNLNNSLTNNIYNHTNITTGNNGIKNSNLTEIPSAITSIYCPLCDLPIGPRLFLPTHLSSVHKLSPTDPDFFMNMLRAKPMSKIEKPNDLKCYNHLSATQTKSINDNFQEESTVNNNIHQPNVNNHHVNGCTSPSGKNEDQININNYCDDLILKELQSSNQKSEPKVINSESTANSSDLTNTKPLDIGLQSQPIKSLPNSLSNQLSPNDIAQYISTNTSTNSLPYIPFDLVNNLETQMNDSNATELSRIPLSNTPCSSDDSINHTSIAAAAAVAAAAFSTLPINPIATMTAVGAVGDSLSNRSWNTITQLSTNKNVNNQSTFNQLSSEVSPTSSIGNTSNSVVQSGIPRKSPNQMRVLCDICNKWICNKYFLRTHKANKHGVTDPSLGSLECYRSGHEKSFPTMKSHMNTSFRRIMNECSRDTSQEEDKNIGDYTNPNCILSSPCESQVSFKNSSITSTQERRTQNSEQTIISCDNSIGTPLTSSDVSFPLTFQTTVATNLPWLGYGFPYQSSSLVSYPTINYPNILPFPMLPNSDIYPYSQTNIAGKLETTESVLHKSDLHKSSTDKESENEENKNPLNLSLKITSEDQKNICCCTVLNITTNTVSIGNNNNLSSVTTNITNKSQETNITNSKMNWLKRGQLMKKYFKNQYFSSFCINHSRQRLHYISNQLLLSLQLKRKSIQYVRRKMYMKRKQNTVKHIEKIESLPVSTCEICYRTIYPYYSFNKFGRPVNYHCYSKHLQQRQQRRKKMIRSHNSLCELQSCKTNSPVNYENFPTEAIKTKLTFSNKIFCPLCLNGQAFIEFTEFMKHLKQNHSISEYESVMNVFKTQMELYNAQNYVFQTSNFITTSVSVKPDSSDCNNHIPPMNSTVTTMSLAQESSNPSKNNPPFNTSYSHNDIMYDFQENTSQTRLVNSVDVNKSIEMIPSIVVCQPSLVLSPPPLSLSTPFSPFSNSSSLPLCSLSSSTITNSAVSTPRPLGRPLFMPINSFTKTLSTI